MLAALTTAFPHKRIHPVGDAAYHGRPLLVADATITPRLSANTALCAPAPPAPADEVESALEVMATKGQRLPRLAELAATATWRTVTAHRYGRLDTVVVAVIDRLWYAAFGQNPGRAVLVREPDTAAGYDLALFTTDRHSDTERIVERYADPWSIETRQRGRQTAARRRPAPNRLQYAVERTVPFGFLTQTMVIVWYSLFGYHPDDLASRHAAEPWYPDKAEPALRGHARQAPPRLHRRSIYRD